MRGPLAAALALTLLACAGAAAAQSRNLAPGFELLPKGAFVGEVEGFAGGESCDGTFELTAGDYVLFCTITEEEADGTTENHFAEGMATTFTVG